LGWEWWHGWGLWWAESGGEGVGLGVLLEDGDVGVPVGLGGGVSGDGGSISTSATVKSVTGSPGGLSNLSWEVSDGSSIVVDSSGGHCNTSIISCSGCEAGIGGGSWEVGDVTQLLGSNFTYSKRLGSGNRVLVWGEPISESGCSSCCTFTVPGSQHAELCLWHGEHWDIVSNVETISSVAISICECVLNKFTICRCSTSCSTGVLHGVELPVQGGETISSLGKDEGWCG